MIRFLCFVLFWAIIPCIPDDDGLLFCEEIEVEAEYIEYDTRPDKLKEDRNNVYQSDMINQIDLLQALELAGIRINKFYIGKFDKRYNLLIIKEEFCDGQQIDLDTLAERDNTYFFRNESGDSLYYSYIDQIKVISKQEDSSIFHH
ncbi:MAG: hypothetical protein ACOC3T_02080 [Bacteroidota bacterium]